jgi:TetR/AcrR family transcriptional regulator, transcriptional repressor for nem operon
MPAATSIASDGGRRAGRRRAPDADPQATHRTYEALLDAGVEVAERDGLAGLSVNRVVAQAGLAKGTFYVHFADREAFVDALHARFHDRVERAAAAATAGIPPGAECIARAVDAYLDVCLSDRTVKALALESRAEGTVTDSMAARHERFVARAVPSLKAMGWPDTKAAAQLLAAMTSEIAVRELDAGRRLPAARRALRRYLGIAGPERGTRKTKEKAEEER